MKTAKLLFLIILISLFSTGLNAELKKLPVHKEIIGNGDYFDSTFTYDFSSKIGINIKHTDIDEITFDEPMWPEDHFVELPELEFIYNPYLNAGEIAYRTLNTSISIAKIMDFTVVELKHPLSAKVVLNNNTKTIEIYMGENLIYTKEIDKYDVFTRVDWDFEMKKPDDGIGIKLIHALYSEVILDETVEVKDEILAIPGLSYKYNPYYETGEILYSSDDQLYACATIEEKETLLGLINYTDIQPLQGSKCSLTVRTEPVCENKICLVTVSLVISN